MFEDSYLNKIKQLPISFYNMKSGQLPYLFLVLSFLALTGCTQSEEQRDFEREAFRTPESYTETDDQGRIINRDEDDWRISPLYQALVEVRPPFPNPVALGNVITFEITVTGVQSLDGIQVYELRDDGALLELFNTVDITGQASFIVFELNPQQFQSFGGNTGPRGLHRIIIYDFNNQIITYGDIQVD